MVTAVIVAGGNGSRMGKAVNKVFLPLAGKTVLEHTVGAFSAARDIEKIIIVTRHEDIEGCRKLFCSERIKIVAGGKTRQESVYNGLKETESEIVAIHDAARALIEPNRINSAVDECRRYGAAAVGVACVDTLKRTDESGFIVETVDRSGIYRIQTPQVFRTEEIKRAHARARVENFDATDDCALYEKYIGKVRIVDGDISNIKITFPEDLAFAEAILRK